jgi:L-glyceraldehyde 3-phosphate reductase
LKSYHTPCLIHQPKYLMFWRWADDSLLDVLENNGIACIAFSPLVQGLLTNKCLNGILSDSRAVKATGHLQSGEVTAERIEIFKKLNIIVENQINKK